MKSIFLILTILLISITANAQNKKLLNLPHPHDVKKITISRSLSRHYTPDSLSKLLQHFILSEDQTRIPRGKYQTGAFKLKDGTTINWLADDSKSIFLTTGRETRLFIIPTAAEIDKFLTIPNVEDVEEISISSGDVNWFTKDSLLKALPKLVVGGGYKTKMLWQQGTIRLKNGKVLEWKADSKRTFVLYVRGGEKYFQLPNDAEIDDSLNLPKPTEVARIEISDTSAIDWYQPEELLRLLPEFAAIEGTYISKQPFQYGTFLLKSGKKIKWMAGGRDSILLYDGSREQLFKLSRFDAICPNPVNDDIEFD